MSDPHVPSKESVKRCARAIRNTFETDDDREFGSGYFSAHAISEDDVSTWSEAVLRCAVEEAGYLHEDSLAVYIGKYSSQRDAAEARAEKAEAECAILRARSPTHELGYALTCAEKERDRWKERAEYAEKHIASARAMLRIECEEIDANDWEDSLHLSDVIEKHLCRKYHHDIERAERERDAMRAHADRHCATISALSMECDRLRAALNEIASWREGDVGGHMDEPGSAKAARDALGMS